MNRSILRAAAIAALLPAVAVLLPPAGPGVADALGIDVKPPSKVTARFASGGQQGDVPLAACEDGDGHGERALDGREGGDSTWTIESSVGSGSVVPVGTQWTITVSVDSHGPDSKGDDGPDFVRLSYYPTGPIERVGQLSYGYDDVYNHGKDDGGLGFNTQWSGNIPGDPFAVNVDVGTKVNLFTESDGTKFTYSAVVRATAPGVIGLHGLDVWGWSSRFLQYGHTKFHCDLLFSMKWTAVAADPQVAGESATLDARYTNSVTGDANEGTHAISTNVLANDDDQNTPGGPGNTDQVRISSWDGTSVQGGQVVCGTIDQQEAPDSAPFSSLSTGPCLYTPPNGFAGTDSYDYVVRSASTGGETTGKVIVKVLPNHRPTATATTFGTLVNTDEVFDLTPVVGDADGDPVDCYTQGGPNPAVGDVMVGIDCSVTWDNTSPGFTGDVSFNYRVCDRHTLRTNAQIGVGSSRTGGYAAGDLDVNTGRRCATATATIRIGQGLLAPPTGVMDVDVMDAWYSEDGQTATSLSIPVLANDTDINGPAPTMPSAALEILAGPDAAAGSASVVGDRIVFTAADGFFGGVGITYRVCEDPADQTPPYLDDPETEFIDEGLPLCGVGEVVIAVQANQRPQPASDAIEMEPTDVVTNFDVSANDTEPDGEGLQCVPGALVADLPAKVSAMSIDANCLLDIDPEDGATGTVIITYTVCDDHVLGDPTWETNPYTAGGNNPGDPWVRCRTRTVTVELLWDLDLQIAPPGSEPPACNPDATTTKNTVPVSLNVLANDVDEDDLVFTYSPTDENPAGTTKGGNWYVSGPGTVTYVPPAGYVGVDTFEYTASDVHGQDCTATVTIDVTSSGTGGRLPDTGNGSSTGWMLWISAVACGLGATLVAAGRRRARAS
ncbi:MAG TPA: hypothetical protein DCR14_00130 [Acidimicrobiaceae bacterium]|nr:hypothetical protein [Acidimicrobiaceae bacterium]